MTLSPAGLRRLEALEVLATSSKPIVAVSLPFRLDSRANDHRSQHWAPGAKKNAKQRMGTHLALSSKRRQLQQMLAVGLVVRVIRIAPSELDSHDNLGMALKAVTDGVADALGVNDRDQRVTFVPDAEKGAWGARVEFYERGDA